MQYMGSLETSMQQRTNTQEGPALNSYRFYDKQFTLRHREDSIEERREESTSKQDENDDNKFAHQIRALIWFNL